MDDPLHAQRAQLTDAYIHVGPTLPQRELFA
jgi:hypothetical protein